MYVRSYPNPFEQMLRQNGFARPEQRRRRQHRDPQQDVRQGDRLDLDAGGEVSSPVSPRSTTSTKPTIECASPRTVARQDGDLRSGGEGAPHVRADSQAPAVHRALPRQPGDSSGAAGPRGWWTRRVLRDLIGRLNRRDTQRAQRSSLLCALCGFKAVAALVRSVKRPKPPRNDQNSNSRDTKSSVASISVVVSPFDTEFINADAARGRDRRTAPRRRWQSRAPDRATARARRASRGARRPCGRRTSRRVRVERSS